ncbi:hypothetical protein O3P69_018474 [Scylla paramamosain]|uniref:Uncharacterized protein n=1 Tax=Scylla paramamosain TaxID=85552 RepID=A0AAW0T1H7_SCYPA
MINPRISGPIIVYGRVTRGRGGHSLRFLARPSLQVTPAPRQVASRTGNAPPGPARWRYITRLASLPSPASPRPHTHLTTTPEPRKCSLHRRQDPRTLFSLGFSAQGPFLERKTTIIYNIRRISIHHTFLGLAVPGRLAPVPALCGPEIPRVVMIYRITHDKIQLLISAGPRNASRSLALRWRCARRDFHPHGTSAWKGEVEEEVDGWMERGGEREGEREEGREGGREGREKNGQVNFSGFAHRPLTTRGPAGCVSAGASVSLTPAYAPPVWPRPERGNMCPRAVDLHLHAPPRRQRLWQGRDLCLALIGSTTSNTIIIPSLYHQAERETPDSVDNSSYRLTTTAEEVFVSVILISTQAPSPGIQSTALDDDQTADEARRGEGRAVWTRSLPCFPASCFSASPQPPGDSCPSPWRFSAPSPLNCFPDPAPQVVIAASAEQRQDEKVLSGVWEYPH